jgi:hypothetical protein
MFHIMHEPKLGRINVDQLRNIAEIYRRSGPKPVSENGTKDNHD